MQVQLLPEADEVYVLCRSAGRAQKERAMRRRWLRRLFGDLRSLRRRVREEQLLQRELIQRQIGRLQERHPQAWRWLKWELQEGVRAAHCPGRSAHPFSTSALFGSSPNSSAPPFPRSGKM